MNNDLNINKIDDTISRQAAIEAIGEKPVAWSKGEYERGLQNQWGYDVSAIKQLPPAQPEPKRGKWVLVCDNNGMHFICNKCGAWRYHQEQNFCGECGADMKEVTT